MGTNEMAQALGISKAMVSKLSGRGMPLSSPQAAQAWRETNAKPRQWKSKSATASPITPRSKSAPVPSSSAPSAAPSPESPDSTDLPGDPADGPPESLRRARATERQSFKKLEALQREKNASPEDLRKCSSVYFSSRANRQKAEQDFREWQRAEGITLFLSEAQDITNRGHLAVANQLREGPKMLVPRLTGMSAKSQEKTLAAFFDSIAAQLYQAF